MASVQATRIASSGWLSRIEGVLMGSTAMNRSVNRYAFGVVKATEFSARHKVRPATGVAGNGLSVVDVRDRIREFLDGTFSPTRLGELISYLKDRMLRLESRRTQDGRYANYIVDVRSKQEILASAVDARLSRPGIARIFGRTIEAEAEAQRLRQQRTPEERLAHSLRNENAAFLVANDTSSAFEDWDDVSFSSVSMFHGREIAAQGTELWTGHVFARASSDPRENLRLIQKARAEGREIVYPARNRAAALRGEFTPGMPILYKEGAVRTALIDPRLTYRDLATRFGKGLHDHVASMHKRFAGQMGATAQAKVVDIQAFKDQFVRRRPEADVVQMRAEPRPVSGRASYAVRHEVDEMGSELLTIVDRVTGQEMPFDPKTLGAGRYVKEDGFGLPSGHLVVDADGGYSHLDEKERFHNVLGPAIVPAAGSGDAPRHAIGGRFLEGRDFDRERQVAMSMGGSLPEDDVSPSLLQRR